MATVNILQPAFGIKWAQDGTVEAIDEAQWRAGWSFIGSTPPSVEQFNKVHQVQDEKTNYLYAQMAAIFTAAGETPSAGDLTSLRDAIALLYGGGRLIGTRVITATSVYTPTAGTSKIRVRMCGSGSSGNGTPATGAGLMTACSGGGAGSYAEAIYTTGFSGVTVTVPAGGVGVANGVGTGSAASFGALLTCPGGGSGGIKQIGTSTVAAQSDQGGGGTLPTGSGIIYAVRGQNGFPGVLYGTAGESFGGGGGSGPMGTGAGNTTSVGAAASGYGAGGSGATSRAGDPARAGGNGSPAICIIEEFA